MRSGLATAADGGERTSERRDAARWGRLCTVNLSDDEEEGEGRGGESVTEERLKKRRRKKISLLLAWLRVFLFGLFGGLLLIKLLLHDAPS